MLKDKRLAEEKKVAEAKAKADEEKKKKALKPRPKQPRLQRPPLIAQRNCPRGGIQPKTPSLAGPTTMLTKTNA